MERKCSECETILESKNRKKVCSEACAKKRIARWHKEFVSRNPNYKPPQNQDTIKKTQQRSEARNQVVGYLRHRALIFQKFGKSQNGIKNIFFQNENWETRLSEMDSIFIDELCKNTPPTIRVDSLVDYLMNLIQKQNDEFKRKQDYCLNKEDRLNKIKWGKGICKQNNGN